MNAENEPASNQGRLRGVYRSSSLRASPSNNLVRDESNPCARRHTVVNGFSDGSIPRGFEPLASALKFKNLMNLRLRARKERRATMGISSRFITPQLALMQENDQSQELLSNSDNYGTLSLQQPSIGEEIPETREIQNLMSLKALLTSNPLNLLLLLIPFAVVAEISGWGPSSVFLLSFFAILPLAQLLGDFTEEVALYTNETIGGLINATLGNATEMIISIFAIRKGLLRVVQVSLLGSVLSNQLLVTGCCFFFGGLKHSEQYFNPHIAAIDSSLLLMAVLGLTVPSAFAATERMDCFVPCKANEIVSISHATAVLLFSLYVLLLFFQLKTHKHLMNAEKGNADEDEEDDDEADEEASMTLSFALVALGVTTLLVALCSEFLVNSLEEVSAKWGLSEVFIGLILLPIIGNAAEHATAVTVAMKGKMDLALGVALGSSVQIALCVVPALCLVGWIMDKPLTLDFHPFETIVLVVSVLVVNSTVTNGMSTWLEGVMLAMSYCIIGIAYYFRQESTFLDEVNCICGEACCAPSR